MSSGPSKDLLTSFANTITGFNGCYNTDYSGFKQYLHPNVPLLIEHVDDPGKFQPGDAAAIIKYLKKSQADTKNYPQFYFNLIPPPNPYEHTTEIGQTPVGDVTGTGFYQDAHSIQSFIPVQYSLRFERDANNYWLLCTALVVPTGPAVNLLPELE